MTVLSDEKLASRLREVGASFHPAEKRKVVREAAIKVLRETPERFKRERVYQVIDMGDPAGCWALRETMGDTDGDRDTKDEEP